MSDNVQNYEIMFAVYGTEDGAAGAVQALKDMDKAKSIKIVDAATIVKDAEGNTQVKQESVPQVKKGLGVGALIGGAVGLLFPPSLIASAAIGAGIGAGTAELFVKEGGKVIVADFQELQGQAKAEELGDAARFIRCDVTDEDEVKARFTETLERFEQVDSVFANAGGGGCCVVS